jgi:hypothetical protein
MLTADCRVLCGEWFISAHHLNPCHVERGSCRTKRGKSKSKHPEDEAPAISQQGVLPRMRQLP